MGMIFDFGPYWDTGTFVLFLAIGISVVSLCRAGARVNAKRNIKLKKEQTYNPINIYYVLAFFILWFFYTFKSEYVGTDTSTYLQYFRNAAQLKIDIQRIYTFNQIEPLYILFTKLIRQVTENYTVYFAAIGGIIAFGYIKFIRSFWNSKSDYIFLIPFIVSYQNSMSGVRNAIGISFILMSLCALKNNKYIKAIVLTIIGTLFHYTISINLFVIMYYLLFVNRNRINKSKVVLLSTAIVALTIAFMSNLKTFLAGTKYGYYFEIGGGTVIGNWYVIFGILLAVYALFKYTPKQSKDSVNIFVTLSNLMVLLIVLKTGAYRLPYYYAFSRMNVWSYVTEKLNERQHGIDKLILKTFAFIFVVFYLLFRMSRGSSNPGFEYNFVFMNK